MRFAIGIGTTQANGWSNYDEKEWNKKWQKDLLDENAAGPSAQLHEKLVIDQRQFVSSRLPA